MKPSTLALFGLLALGLAGCESLSSLNPFEEKDTVLPGERRPVFGPGDPFAGPQRLPPPLTEGVEAPAAPATGPAPARR